MRSGLNAFNKIRGIGVRITRGSSVLMLTDFVIP